MAKRLRGRAGQQQRLRRLQRTNGLCERCLAAGRTVAAVVVDHIVPLAHGGSDDDGNTRNLCRACDREVTAEQFGFNTARGARGVGVDGRPRDREHPWSSAAPLVASAPRRIPRGVQSGQAVPPDTAQGVHVRREVSRTKKFGPGPVEAP